MATGKAMLAVQDEAVIEGLSERLFPFTATTMRSMDEVRETFAAIRRDGVAYNRGDWREDVYGAATPIWDASGRIVASIGISGPASRLSTGRLEELSGDVLAAGRRASRLLGFLGQPDFATEPRRMATARH